MVLLIVILMTIAGVLLLPILPFLPLCTRLLQYTKQLEVVALGTVLTSWLSVIVLLPRFCLTEIVW